MNDLSWLIYFVNIIATINDLAGFFALLALLGASFLIVPMIASLAFDEDLLENNQRARAKSLFKIVNIVGIIATTIYIVTPGRTTLALILASEVGEKVVTNEDVNELSSQAKEYFKLYLESQTQELKKEIFK